MYSVVFQSLTSNLAPYYWPLYGGGYTNNSPNKWQKQVHIHTHTLSWQSAQGWGTSPKTLAEQKPTSVSLHPRVCLLPHTSKALLHQNTVTFREKPAERCIHTDRVPLVIGFWLNTSLVCHRATFSQTLDVLEVFGQKLFIFVCLISAPASLLPAFALLALH